MNTSPEQLTDDEKMDNPLWPAFLEDIEPTLGLLFLTWRMTPDQTMGHNQIIAQQLMDLLAHPRKGPDEPLSLANKKDLVDMAHYMGPDWCQALYRASVFMTKVV